MDSIEAQFYTLIQQASIAIGVSRNGVILYANCAFLKMFGFERADEIVGKPIVDHWAPEWRAMVNEAIHHRSGGLRVSTEFEATALRKDGSQFTAQVGVTTADLPNGWAMMEFITDLTEREQAKEALRQRNRYIETILEEAPIGFAVHTVDDGVARFVSARFEEIYGVPRGAIDSHYTFFDKVWPYDPDLREQIRARVVADMTSGDPSRMHWENVPVQTANGENRYITAMNIPVLDQNLMVSTVQDVTENVRAQAALRESEERFRGLFEGSIEGISWSSQDGKILMINPAMAKMLGYDSPQAAIRTISDLGQQVWMDPEERSRFIRQLEEQGTIRGYEMQFRRKDGTKRWSLLNGRSVLGPDGRIAHLEIFATDITERKQIEEALEKSRSLLAEIERIGRVGAWEIHLDAMKLTWTPEIYSIHEVDLTYEPTLEKAIQFYAPASRTVIERLVRRAIEQGEPYDVELEIITAKGNHRSIHAIGRVDQEHRRVYGFFQDITASKQAEREMSQLRLELTHLTRVLTLNEISGSLAHEINQPLGAILNNAEAARRLLTRAQDQRAEIPEIVEDIIQDVKRAGDVVRKVRTLVKKTDRSFESLSINALIEDVLALLHSTLTGNNVTLRLDLKPDDVIIRGDRVRLQQVLLNLVTNAMDAIKEAPSKILAVRSAMDGPDMVTVSVSDSGPGIDEARRELLFQPFCTTKKDGLGLGLSICQSIIREHGGRIWEENQPGGGATFSFSLKAWTKESG